MTIDNRFSTLSGSSRRWIQEDLIEPDELREVEDSCEPDEEHDGWSAIRPRAPIARLGDISPALRVA